MSLNLPRQCGRLDQSHIALGLPGVVKFCWISPDLHRSLSVPLWASLPLPDRATTTLEGVSSPLEPERKPERPPGVRLMVHKTDPIHGCSVKGRRVVGFRSYEVSGPDGLTFSKLCERYPIPRCTTYRNC